MHDDIAEDFDGRATPILERLFDAGFEPLRFKCLDNILVCGSIEAKFERTRRDYDSAAVGRGRLPAHATNRTVALLPKRGREPGARD